MKNKTVNCKLILILLYVCLCVFIRKEENLILDIVFYLSTRDTEKYYFNKIILLLQ